MPKKKKRLNSKREHKSKESGFIELELSFQYRSLMIHNNYDILIQFKLAQWLKT